MVKSHSKTFLLMLSWYRKIPFVVLKQNNKVIKGLQSILILFTMVIVISEDLKLNLENSFLEVR